jgi:hypothetical protein
VIHWRSLEIGYWTEEAQPVKGVERFLVDLIGASEDLDAPSDTPDPELVEVESTRTRWPSSSCGLRRPGGVVAELRSRRDAAASASQTTRRLPCARAR